MRLFYALMPTEAMMAALRTIMVGVSGARWQDDPQLHLTLRFIGDVSGRTADDLAGALLARPITVPPIGLSGVGFFEGHRRPNALWVRATPRDPLALLHRKLDRACQSAGLEPEHRAYIPHVTVARLSRNAGPIDAWIEANAGFAIPPMPFARCSLVESTMTDAGSHYEELAWVPLA